MPSEQKRSKPSTTAQIAANRRNAEKSTGPRTPGGKARSSRNSTLHGAYASGLAAVEHGPFSEDPDEVADFVRALVAGLAPQDALERARAESIARIHLTERRLERYECALLEARVIGAKLEHEATADDLEDSVIDHIVAWNESRFSKQSGTSIEGGLAQSPWDHMAVWIRGMFAPQLKVRDLWDDEHEPTSTQDWRRAFEAVAKHRFPTSSGLRDALREANAQQARRTIEREDHARRSVADASLFTLQRCQAERARLTNDLSKQLLIYAALQERGSNGSA